MAPADAISRNSWPAADRASKERHRGVLGITELASWYGQDSAKLEEELGIPQLADEVDGWEDEWDDDAPLFPDDGQEGPAS